MGLDMYVETQRGEDETTRTQLAYWRNHDALNEFLFARAEGRGELDYPYEDDACCEFELFTEDIAELERAALSGRLDAGSNFIGQAYAALGSGVRLFYWASW
jgi:hypothetical protein